MANSIFSKMYERTDIVEFVREVEKHPCLYNKNIREYSDKIKQGQAWHEIAKAMGTTAIDCRDKWRKIRISFIRSLKLQNSSKPPGRPYYLYDALSFLLPYTKPGASSSSLFSSQRIKSDVSRDSTSRDVEESDSSMDNYQDNLDNDVSFVDVSLNMPKEENDTLAAEAPQARRQFEVESNNTSARQLFLSSLMPEIESFSEQEMRVFRREVITIIDSIISERDRRINVQ